MGILDTLVNGGRFTDTIFYKKTSDLQDKYDALKKLNEEYPNNEDLQTEMYIVKKGLAGENEIAYQLEKSNIGMYVLRDIKLKYENLTAQIDYIIITPIYIYLVECKNLVGNIMVNENGDFINEYTIKGKKVRKGMYSPLRQVEAQREVLRKIWVSNASKFTKLIASSWFNYYRRTLVVAANPETILNTSKAPKEIKSKVLRADALVRKLKTDFENRRSDDVIDSQKAMEKTAQSYIDISFKDEENYYEYYKNKFCSNNFINKNVDKVDELKNKLIEFRKERSKELNIPAYYVFTNYELDELIELKPKTIEELKNSKVLSSIKLKTHGAQIVDLFNKN